MASNKSVLNKRILETRKQTEELREQLQNLRDSGSDSLPVYSEVADRSNFNKENVEESHSEVPIIKSHGPNPSLHANKPSAPKVSTDMKQISKKTQQTLTKNSTKEGIGLSISGARSKKHEEKYWEQVKLEDMEKTKADRKQKLLELHKKAIDIVTKNVQAKRERSQSRERTSPLQLNEHITKKSRSISQERNFLGGSRSHSAEDKRGKCVEKSDKLFETEKRNPNLLYPPLPDYITRGRERKRTTAELPQNQNKEPLSRNINRSEFDIDIKQKPLKPTNLFNPLHCSNEYLKDRTENADKNINVNKSSCNITLRSKQDNIEVRSNTVSDSIQKERNWRTNYEQREEPEQASANYIHTVKQKLQQAVNTHKPKGGLKITSSFVNDISQKKDPENINTKGEIFDVLQQSTKSSKMSHKSPNFVHGPKIPEPVSELNTSRNISSKRGTWLTNTEPGKQNVTSGLNIEIVSNIKFSPRYAKSAIVESERGQYSLEVGLTNSKPPSCNAESEVQKPSSQNIFTVEDELAFDFSFESDLCRSRESIISFNSPTYNKVVTYSPNVTSEKYANETPYLKNSPSHIPENVSCAHSDSFLKCNVSTIGNQETTQRNNISMGEDEGEVSNDGRKLINVVSNPNNDDGTCSDNITNRLDLRMGNFTKKSVKDLLQNASLCAEYHPTASDDDRISKYDCNLQYVNTRRGSDISSKVAINSLTHNEIEHSHSANLETCYLTKTKEVPGSKNQPTYSSENVFCAHSVSVSDRSASRFSKQEPKHMLEARGNTAVDSKKLISAVSTSNSTGNVTNSETDEKFTTASREGTPKPNSEHYTSLYTEYHPTASDADRMSKSESNLQRDSGRDSGTSSEADKLIGIFPQRVSPNVAGGEAEEKHEDKRKSKLAKNISLRSDWNLISEELHNEVHSKFEAEVDLLNSFNDSLLQFTALEKALESIESKKSKNGNKEFRNQDTQTSRTNPSTSMQIAEDTEVTNTTKGELPSINYSRGSGIDVGLNSINLDSILSRLEHNTNLVSTGLEISSLNMGMSTLAKSNFDMSNFENFNSNNFAGMSLRMFEQLIKDEDVRLENLKAILKIREKALLDRTRGELAWLEIQRKHLRETGKLQEASFIKTKQRGILVSHQKEKHEMKRLKEMEKAASQERKIILKEQRNLIKHQLCSDHMLSKMKVNTPRERRLSGPLKVVQSQESIKSSETSISRISSNDKDVYSITSHTHSIVSKVSEISGHEARSTEAQFDLDAVNLADKFTGEACGVPISQLKQTLLMREAALEKRRRGAEELLQWHKKLLEEEKRIIELELAASALISKKPDLMGGKIKKSAEDKTYPMSQTALEPSHRMSSKTKETPRKANGSVIITKSTEPRTGNGKVNTIPYHDNIRDVEQGHMQSSPHASLENHTADLDIKLNLQILNDLDEDLNQLIDDFSKIQEDIFSLSRRQSLNTTQGRELEQYTSTVFTDTNTNLKETEEIQSSLPLPISGLTPTSEDKISLCDKNAFKDVEGKNEEVLIGSITAKERSKSSTIEETVSKLKSSSKEVNMLSEDEGIVPILNRTEDVCKENDGTVKVLESLDQLEDKIVTDPSTVENFTMAKEQQTKDNVTNENILQEAIQTESKPNFGDGNHVSDEGKESPCIEEVFLGIPEDKINTDVPGDIQTSQKSLLDERSVGGECKLNKTEEIVSGSRHGGDRICINTPIQPSLAIVDDLSSFDNKTEVIVAEVEQLLPKVAPKNKIIVLNDILIRGKELDDVSSNRISGTEEIQSSSGMNKTSALTVDNIAAKDFYAFNENLSEKSLNESSLIIIESAEKVGLEETKEEDLCIDEESTFGDIFNAEILPAAEVIGIKDTPTIVKGDDDKTIEVIEILEDTMELPLSILPLEEKMSGPTVESRQEGGSRDEEIISFVNSPGENEQLQDVHTEIQIDDEEHLEDTGPAANDDVNIYGEKEGSLSLSGINVFHVIEKEDKSIPVIRPKSGVSSEEASPKNEMVNAYASKLSWANKEPSLQDLYITPYAQDFPTGTAQLEAPTEEKNLKEQLAIEQEVNNIVPTTDEIEEITRYSANTLHDAYLSFNLDNITISEDTLGLISKNITKQRYMFVFDLCKEILKKHYKKFEKETCPSWMQTAIKPQLATVKPLHISDLEKHLIKSLNELFRYTRMGHGESAIIRWSHKYRDHIDDVLLMDMREEEAMWVNCDKDEMIVMNDVVNTIMNTLLSETCEVFSQILSKRTYLY